MKKNKRIVPLWLWLAACLFLGACSAPQSAPAESTAAETTAAETTTIKETEPAPTEPPVREPSEIRIGMIFYGEEGDGSVLAAAQREGLLQAAVGLGITQEQILWQYNGRDADWTQIEDSILACVEAGCQVIFGGAREYGAVIAAIAEEYPDVMFACVGSDLYNGTNSGTYSIGLAAAQYLCGAAAAAANQTGRIGFLASKDTSDPEVTDAINAFAYGVWSVNPQAVVEVGVTGKWFLPEAERQAVSKLQGLGCDVIGGYTDCAAGLQAAAAAGLHVLGVGTDDAAFYGNGYENLSLGAAVYRFDLYFTMKLNQVIQKEVAGEAWTGDYYSKAAEFRSTGEISQEALLQLASWQPIEEGAETESPETQTGEGETAAEETKPSEQETQPLQETAEESQTEAAAETQTNAVEETQTDAEADTQTQTADTSAETQTDAETDPETDPAETSLEEETEQEEIPAVTLDRETGYLTNVRIHEIELPEAESEE
ncbi:MAG: BMP family ABC transporter substrate-binding protein [Lachnospiraceae bacterium]|nr:BMP family ABC transporter substrate-binding protein [Lachnospiraceae bacterium]